MAGNENNLMCLENYLNVLAQIPENGYQLVGRQDNHDPAIPNNVRQQVYDIYNNECALRINRQCLTINGNNQDIEKDIHHLVTRDFFRRRNIYNSDIVNDIRNLMLLCFRCHDRLSSADINERTNFLNHCLNVLRRTNRFNDFEQYLYDVVHITIPLLYRMYGVRYEE